MATAAPHVQGTHPHTPDRFGVTRSCFCIFFFFVFLCCYTTLYCILGLGLGIVLSLSLKIVPSNKVRVRQVLL